MSRDVNLTAPLRGRFTLRAMLQRGDYVAIECGRLVINPVSGLPVPVEWLADNEARIMLEAIEASGVFALRYLSYQVGHYGKVRAGGVTLQFCHASTGCPFYAVFNVETKRKRNTAHGKAGEPLPKGRFSVQPKSAFAQFWRSTGLPLRRLSDLADYMGNLSRLMFTADLTGQDERLCARSLRPLNLTHRELAQAFDVSLPDKAPTRLRQHPDKAPTRITDKETQQGQQSRAIQAESTTGTNNYGNKVIREYGKKGDVSNPLNQSVDDWLADYEQSEAQTIQRSDRPPAR